MRSTEDIHDVVIVGYGPVGQALAGHLGHDGLDVCVFERFPALYNRPRAVRMDHEAMRMWQNLGIVEELADDLFPVDEYEWFGADGEPLLRFTIPRGPSGWAHSYTFYQPYFEATLDRFVRAHPNVEVHQGWTMTGLRQHDEFVEVELFRTATVQDASIKATTITAERRTARARYLVGADGAKSTVRKALGISFQDLGFSERWVSVDLKPYDMNALPPLTTSRMYCDPKRPHVNCPNGKTHRRWEWMLLDGESPAGFRDDHSIWKLLSDWITCDQAELVRWAVYEFHCGVAETMRAGRCFLAGDAAHLMPPHMGEGLCTGFRDVANLAWKLALELRDQVADSLLQTYTLERLPHSLALVRRSEQMGKISCELDPARAAARDNEIRAQGGLGAWPFPALEDGLLHKVSGILTPLAGQLSVQGTIALGGRSGRLDDIVGHGFTLVSLDGDPDRVLSEEQLEYLDRLRTHYVWLGGEGPRAASDVDGELTAWLRTAGAAAVLIRPDFYVFGSARTPVELPGLVDDLSRQLGAVPPRSPRPELRLVGG